MHVWPDAPGTGGEPGPPQRGHWSGRIIRHMLALNQDKDAWGKDLQESVVTLSRTAKVGPRAVPSFSIGNMKQCRRCKRLGFDPWVGKISGEGNGNPLQYSSQESPMHRGAWQTMVHGVAESQTWLSTASTLASLGRGQSSVDPWGNFRPAPASWSLPMSQTTVTTQPSVDPGWCLVVLWEKEPPRLTAVKLDRGLCLHSIGHSLHPGILQGTRKATQPPKSENSGGLLWHIYMCVCVCIYIYRFNIYIRTPRGVLNEFKAWNQIATGFESVLFRWSTVNKKKKKYRSD